MSLDLPWIFPGSSLDLPLVGRPSQAQLLPDFERAVAFLSDTAGHAPARVVREEDVNGLVDEFTEAVREHEGSGQLKV